MSDRHDNVGDPQDRALAALYRTHLGDRAGHPPQPSAKADARIRALARESVTAGAVESRAFETVTAPANQDRLRPAAVGRAPASRSGWRSWLESTWFKPGLAFAALASISVVIVALMPREDLEVEKSESLSGGSAPSAARMSPGETPGSRNEPAPSGPVPGAAVPPAPAPFRAPASPVSVPPAGSAPSTTTANAQPPQQSPALRDDSAAAAAARPPAAAQGSMRESDASSVPKVKSTQLPPLRAKTAPAEPESAAPSGPSTSPAPVPATPPRAAPQPAAPPPTAAPAARAPNPFPAQSHGLSDRRADAASDAGARGGLAASAQRPAAAPEPPGAARAQERAEKQSIVNEPEYRSGEPLPEVRDSVPTYPNEQRSSIPMPNTYVTPRARDSQQPSGGYASELARAPSMALAKPRKEDSLQKRAAEATPHNVAPQAAPRDPAEWIKAILKLRAEGRQEQVLKELAEFRKQHPAYPLPEELKPLAAAAAK